MHTNSAVYFFKSCLVGGFNDFFRGVLECGCVSKRHEITVSNNFETHCTYCFCRKLHHMGVSARVNKNLMASLLSLVENKIEATSILKLADLKLKTALTSKLVHKIYEAVRKAMIWTIVAKKVSKDFRS